MADEYVDDGGPAYPWGEHGVRLGGMTMRDWFAGQALVGHLAYSYSNPTWGDYHTNGTDADLAAKVYRMADEMLAARKK